MDRPTNFFQPATVIIGPISMVEEPFVGITDPKTLEALKLLEGNTYNVIRAANEMFWCQEKAWKTYRLSSQDMSSRTSLRPSDQLEIFWWAFVNYIYQFEEKSKLFLNCYKAFSPLFDLKAAPCLGGTIKRVSKRLRKYTEFRHVSLHESHYPPAVIGHLPLVECMQENIEFYRRLPDTEYLALPPKYLFRLTRSHVHSEMESGMEEMASIAADILLPHARPILLAAYKVASYTQWAKAGQVTFKFGS
jgi:hypothetical protein